MRIVETDNHGGDYPNESFVNLPYMTERGAKAVADAINAACGWEGCRRYWKVVPDNYTLQPGFEP